MKPSMETLFVAMEAYQDLYRQTSWHQLSDREGAVNVKTSSYARDVAKHRLCPPIPTGPAHHSIFPGYSLAEGEGRAIPPASQTF